MSEPLGTEAYQAVIASPLPGRPCLGLHMQDGNLTSIEFLTPPSCKPFVGHNAEVAGAASWLQAYFLHRSGVEPPCRPEGTAFQHRVWEQLRRIPIGQAVTYGELARTLDSSARAVAGACRANPIPILIPCHRVVAATGLGGYMGETGGEALAIKQWLLQHEGYV